MVYRKVRNHLFLFPVRVDIFFLLLSFCNRRIYFLYLKPTEITLLTKHSKLGIFLAFFYDLANRLTAF